MMSERWRYINVDGREVRITLSDETLAQVPDNDGWRRIIEVIRADLQEQRDRAEKAEKELAEAYWTITGMRVQIQEWIDEGVSRADMAAFLKENG